MFYFINKVALTCVSNRELFAGSLESAYSLNLGTQELLGKARGETLALL